MFSKEKADARHAGLSRRRQNSPVSLISPDLVVSGNLSSPGDIQLDGTIEGDIKCQSLTIGVNAKVKGHIKADEVLVCGTITGNIDAQTVTLAKTARVCGDILQDSIAIEAGARLDGRLSGRIREPAAAAEPDGTANPEQAERIQMIRRQI